jgi:hypothetical protein
MPVDAVARSLRKLLRLLEVIPPSFGTEEPWKRVWDFASGWLYECQFILTEPELRKVEASQRGAAVGSGESSSVNGTAVPRSLTALPAAVTDSKCHAKMTGKSEIGLSSFEQPILYDICCMML